jgi:hypothetical protein
MEPGTKTSKSSCVLEMRGQPEVSTGSPLDWKSQSELPDVLLGYKESKIGPCGGVDALQNEKTAHRGAGNVEATASTTIERSDLRDFIGCHSRRAHIRRERWQLLESDHCNPERKRKRRARERKKKMLQAQPSEEKKW